MATEGWTAVGFVGWAAGSLGSAIGEGRPNVGASCGLGFTGWTAGADGNDEKGGAAVAAPSAENRGGAVAVVGVGLGSPTGAGLAASAAGLGSPSVNGGAPAPDNGVAVADAAPKEKAGAAAGLVAVSSGFLAGVGAPKVKAEPASVPDGAPKLKEGRDGPPAAEAAVTGAEGTGGFIAAPRPCDA